MKYDFKEVCPSCSSPRVIWTFWLGPFDDYPEGCVENAYKYDWEIGCVYEGETRYQSKCEVCHFQWNPEGTQIKQRLELESIHFS